MSQRAHYYFVEIGRREIEDPFFNLTGLYNLKGLTFFLHKIDQSKLETLDLTRRVSYTSWGPPLFSKKK